MKFILKNKNTKIDFLLVTEDLNDLIKKVGIGYSELDNVAALHKNLSFDEAASFILLQRAMANLLGKQEHRDYFEGDDLPEHKPLKARVENGADITQYFIELLDQHNSYFYRNGNSGIVVMIANKGSKEIDYPGWTLLEGDKLSLAITDVLFRVYGYQDVHFNPIVNVGPDEFTLSNAFYALEQGY